MSSMYNVSAHLFSLCRQGLMLLPASPSSTPSVSRNVNELLKARGGGKPEERALGAACHGMLRVQDAKIAWEVGSASPPCSHTPPPLEGRGPKMLQRHYADQSFFPICVSGNVIVF